MADELFSGTTPDQQVSLDDGYIVHEKQPHTTAVGDRELFYQDVAVLEEQDEGYEVIEQDRRMGVRDDETVKEGADAIYEAITADVRPATVAVTPVIEGYEQDIAKAVVEVYDQDQTIDEVFATIADHAEGELEDVAAQAHEAVGRQIVNDVRASFGYSEQEVHDLAETYIKFAVNQQHRNYDDPALFDDDTVEQMHAIEALRVREEERETFRKQTQRLAQEAAANGEPFNPEGVDVVTSAVEEYLFQQRREGIDYRSLLNQEEESDAIETITTALRERGYTEAGAEEALAITARHIPDEIIE